MFKTIIIYVSVLAALCDALYSQNAVKNNIAPQDTINNRSGYFKLDNNSSTLKSELYMDNMVKQVDEFITKLNFIAQSDSIHCNINLTRSNRIKNLIASKYLEKSIQSPGETDDSILIESFISSMCLGDQPLLATDQSSKMYATCRLIVSGKDKDDYIDLLLGLDSVGLGKSWIIYDIIQTSLLYPIKNQPEIKNTDSTLVFILPSAHEVGFQDLSNKINKYKSIKQMMVLQKRGNQFINKLDTLFSNDQLIAQSVTNIKIYIAFQNEYVIELQEHLDKASKSGWLISNVMKGSGLPINKILK